MRIRLIAAALALVASGIVYGTVATQNAGVETNPPNAPDQKPAFAGQTRAPERKANVAYEVVTFAEGLQNPWGMTFLPDGRLLVNEKPGRMRIVSTSGTLSEPVTGLPAVDARSQGGLLDVTLDPNFASNQLIYWSYAEPATEPGTNNKIGRAHV